MQNTKIGDYFTPVQPRGSKRNRLHISPDSPGNEDSLAMGDEKVGDMTLAQLMAGMSNLLESKLNEKFKTLATKEDISSINDKVNELVTENEALREEVAILKHQGKVTCDRLIDLEARSRRNNLIFKGLQWNGKNADFREIVTKFCKDVLGAERVWVNRAHPLGKDGKSIIAHIPEDADIAYILSQTRKLRGTGYVIHRDFPREIRDKRALLVSVRAEIERVAGKEKMPLVHDHLYVRGHRFSWEEGGLRSGRMNGANALEKLFRHDFSDFLAKLTLRKSKAPTQSPTSTPTRSQTPTPTQTFAQTVSKGATQAAESGTSASAASSGPHQADVTMTSPHQATA